MTNTTASTLAMVELSVAEMARLIREKQISPVALVEAHLNRIEQLNPKLNAFISVNAERAMEEARRAEVSVMHKDVPPLLGVPVSVKSCIDVQGMRCPAGSRLREDYIATTD